MPHIHERYDHTISAFVLHPDQTKILLVFHKKLGKMMQIGGHIELDEDPWEALAHEVLEEAGLILGQCQVLLQPDQPRVDNPSHKTLPIPFHYEVHNLLADGSHKHIDTGYALKSYTDQIRPAEGESQEFEWVSQSRLEQLNTDGRVLPGIYQVARWLFANQALWSIKQK